MLTQYARLNAYHARPDGSSDTFWSLSVPCVERPIERRNVTGYGRRIPTRWMVLLNGRWRRVYCRTYSNSGTCFLGDLPKIGERIIVDYLPG